MVHGLWAAFRKFEGFSGQGATLKELEENIRDAYRMMYPDLNPNFTVDALQRIS